MTIYAKASGAVALALGVGFSAGAALAAPVSYTSDKVAEVADGTYSFSDLQPMVFSFTNLAAPVAGETALTVLFEFADLDLGSSFERLYLKVNGVDTGLRSDTKTLTDNDLYDAAGSFSITADFTSFGGFSGGELTLEFYAKNDVEYGYKQGWGQTTVSYAGETSPVPLPASGLLILGGLGGLAALRRRKG